MLETYTEKVLKYLKEKGEITHFEIVKLTNTTCPHDIIRKLKQKVNLLDEWVTIRKKVVLPSGKEIPVSKKFKKYYLFPNVGTDKLE